MPDEYDAAGAGRPAGGALTAGAGAGEVERPTAGGALIGPRGRTSLPQVPAPSAGATCIGLVWKRTAGAGAAIEGLAPGIVAADGLASTGACVSSGAPAITCGRSATTFECTGWRPVNVAPATAVTPPGADQFA